MRPVEVVLFQITINTIVILNPLMRCDLHQRRPCKIDFSIYLPANDLTKLWKGAIVMPPFLSEPLTS
jgi:hypothetical protein